MEPSPSQHKNSPTFEIRPGTVKSRDRQLEAAINALKTAAAVDRQRGIMVTRHRADLYTVQLHDDVPYGLTKQQVLETPFTPAEC